ncbi:hypothetical protein ACJA23_02765 [Mycoplasma corogypsi]|uniref:hypothetical protein n=1 Tax=Mycoplasma corogypsi TaxID=2106 RepID=UPI003872F385
MSKISVRNMAYLGLYVSIIMLLTFVPNTGYINIGPIAIALIFSVILVMTYHLGLLGIMVGCLTIGVLSYIGSLVFGAILFSLPDVAIVPRVLIFIPLALFYVFVIKKTGPKYWINFIFGALIAFSNTFFVSAYLQFRNSVTEYGTIHKIVGDIKTWIILIWVNALVEFLAIGFVGALLTPVCAFLWNKNKAKEPTYA